MSAPEPLPPRAGTRKPTILPVAPPVPQYFPYALDERVQPGPVPARPVVLNDDGPQPPMPLHAFLPEHLRQGVDRFTEPYAVHGDPHGAAQLIRDLVEALRQRARDDAAHP